MSNPPDFSALIDNKAGNYRALPGGTAFCSGVIPYDGYEVVRVLLDRWLPLDQGYAFIEQHLRSIGRPVQAFCGIELRVPAPLAFSDWSTFNVPYLAQLRKWELIFDNLSAVCRSNIALVTHPPKATALCAFSYTVPTSANIKTFFLSGQADVDGSGKIIADGDVGPAAMAARARFVIDTVATTLTRLGASWQETTQVALFHVHDIPDLWGPGLLGSFGDALRRGVLTYRARPPIAGMEVELEARAVRQELVIETA